MRNRLRGVWEFITNPAALIFTVAITFVVGATLIILAWVIFNRVF